MKEKIKFLGEDGENIPTVGAVVVCSPWDLLRHVSLDDFSVDKHVNRCVCDLMSLLMFELNH
ncbi:unnamed protein product [Lupinus luteus]|uniref:Uncharacterized protein n=1 Tax=Lupinus luteus TaxID=3873 RepID=A0AAV1XMF6_LUPLU